MGGGGLDIPEPGSAPDEQAVAFAAGLIDRSGQAPVIEAALAHRTGRPRPLPARAVLTALLCLALDDRPLFLTEVTRLLFCQLPPASRRLLAVPGTATTARAFLAAYRRVRYCFHAILSVADPSALPKNRRLTDDELKARTRPMTPDQATAARDRLEALVNALLEASVSVLTATSAPPSTAAPAWTPPRCRCFAAARPSAPACPPATPTAAGTSARATTASMKTTRASRCANSPGRWKPPSRSPPGRPAPRPRTRTWPPAWPWPGPAKTPAAPAPGCWPPSPPAATSPAGPATTAPAPPRSRTGSTCPPARSATGPSWTTAPTSSASRPTAKAPCSWKAAGTAPPCPNR